MPLAMARGGCEMVTHSCLLSDPVRVRVPTAFGGAIRVYSQTLSGCAFPPPSAERSDADGPSQGPLNPVRTFTHSYFYACVPAHAWFVVLVVGFAYCMKNEAYEFR